MGGLTSESPPAESAEPRLGLKIAEVRVSKLAANLVAIPAAGAIVAAAVLLAWSLPHAVGSRPRDAWQYVLFVILATVVHELLHAWAILRWGEVPSGAVRFGFHWKALMPYFHCRVPVEMAAYRTATLFPLYVTCPIGMLAVLAYPSVWVAAGAGVAVAACTGDVWTFMKLRRFDGRSLVLDHPSEIGCDVFLPEERPSPGTQEGH